MERNAMRWRATLVLAATVVTTSNAHGARVERTTPATQDVARETAAAAAAEAAGEALFSAEVTVERAVVNDQGRVIRDLPRSRYRIEQFAGGRNRMAMLPSTGGPRIGPLADPYAGMVVEFDPAGSGLRLLGADGRPLPGAPALPTSLAPPELGQGHEGFVTPVRDTAKRRGDLSRHFGKRAGSVRRLERYLDTRGTRWQEVLVEPASALPVEVNVMQDGQLEEHHEFTYAETEPGQLVRTRTRSETRVPGTKGQRLVAMTTLVNVRVAGGVE